MISSEVQRTLVKSPPELWAELSDPKSLARHLGELGEIRITKAEPEKLVEWEAEEARGSVAIKASGWGTKVTLKASREYTPPEPEALEPEDVEPEVVEPEAAEILTPELEASPPEPAAEASPEPESEAPSGLDAWSRQEAELTVTAAERFGHEHSASLMGSDLQLAADREPETDDPQAETETEQPELSEPAPEVEAPAPRVGFFARLFGRGRKSRAAPSALIVETGPTDEPVLEADPPVQAISAPSEDPAEAEVSAALDQPMPEVAAAPIVEPQLETETRTETDPEPTPAAQAEIPQSDELPEQSLAAEAISAPEAQISSPSPSPLVDLAAELKAAEEAAEEQVRAILTGVLDRLGAAHHRPFSRS